MELDSDEHAARSEQYVDTSNTEPGCFEEPPEDGPLGLIPDPAMPPPTAAAMTITMGMTRAMILFPLDSACHRRTTRTVEAHALTKRHRPK